MTRRCACRPGCLTWLLVDDVVVPTDDGFALADHVSPAYPAEPAERQEVSS